MTCERAVGQGAMENKSLNVFNSRLVLASPETATDGDFGRIEGVIGHEYFHNWTGNRVTCRDWFQLTLKEGLTVFRDQARASHSLCYNSDDKIKSWPLPAMLGQVFYNYLQQRVEIHAFTCPDPMQSCSRQPILGRHLP